MTAADAGQVRIGVDVKVDNLRFLTRIAGELRNERSPIEFLRERAVEQLADSLPVITFLAAPEDQPCACDYRLRLLLEDQVKRPVPVSWPQGPMYLRLALDEMRDGSVVVPNIAELEPIPTVVVADDSTGELPVSYVIGARAPWLEETLRQIVASWDADADELFGDLPMAANASFDSASGLITDLSYIEYALPAPPQDPQAVFRVRWNNFREEQLFLTCATPNLGGPPLAELPPCEPGERCIPRCEEAPESSEWPTSLATMTWDEIYLVRYHR